MTMQKIVSTIMTAGTLGLSVVTMAAPQIASAANLTADQLFGGSNVGGLTGQAEISNQLGLSNSDIRVTIARIIRVAMGLLGIVAVVIVLIGGFTWMTAGGNDEKVGEAKKWIFAGIIGLAIILSAFAISTFVIDSLVTATTALPGTTVE